MRIEQAGRFDGFFFGTSLSRYFGIGLPVFVCAMLLLTDVKAESGPQSNNPVAASPASHCPSYSESAVFRSADKVTVVNPSNWIHAIENAVDGEEILLEDGVYELNQYAVVFNSSVTLRGLSGDRNSVVIQGKGFGENAEALMIMADDVHIADLTVKDARDHAISIQEGFARPIIYNVNLVDIGTQHIKGNRPGPDGLIACSRLGYTQEISTGDYNSAIDLHGAVNWTIRDNYIYNIYGDGSECVVDAECGTVFPGGEPAILLWRESRDNVIERNTIVESFRGISLGLDTPYSGGIVKDNVICRSQPGKEGVNGFIAGDTGISLLGASDVELNGNRVILAGDYPGPVEVRDAKGLTIVDNFLSKPVWNRGNSDFNGCNSPLCDDESFGNIVDADTSAISCPAEGAVIDFARSKKQPEVTIVVAETDVETAIETVVPQPMAIVQPPATNHELEMRLAQGTLAVREERLIAMEQRLLATNERLMAKEERLKMWESRLSIEERMRTLELQQGSSQFQIDLIVNRLRVLESR